MHLYPIGCIGLSVLVLSNKYLLAEVLEGLAILALLVGSIFSVVSLLLVFVFVRHTDQFSPA